MYQVSDLGRVRSLDRYVNSPQAGGARLIPGRILRPYTERGGYLDVSLSRNSIINRRKVASLVLEAFRGPRPPGMETRHFPSRDPKDNRLVNLQWGTKQQNQGPDKVFQGMSNRGERCGAAKLTEQEVREIKISSEDYDLLRKHYKVSRATIHDIKKGRTWGHLK